MARQETGIDVPRVDDPRLQAFLQRVGQAIQVWNGERGHPLDRVLTLRDLAGGRTAYDVIQRHGGVSGPLPLELSPSPLYIPAPPQPTNLQAVGAMTSVILAWDCNITTTLSHFEIWRNTTDNLSTASLHATTSTRVWADYVGAAGLTYYYWVRAVNIANPPEYSPYNQTAGTSATTGMVKDNVIESLAADKLFVATGTIAQAIIGEGHIDNLMIGNIIQSHTYNPAIGQGWRLDKTGAITAAGITIHDNRGKVILQSDGLNPALMVNLGNVFAEHWDDAVRQPLQAWEVLSGPANELSIVSATGNYGGKALSAGNNSGNDEVWLAHKGLIPFDPNLLYRLRVRFRQLSGTGVVYAGWLGVAADGVTYVSASGANTFTNQHYHAAVNKSPSSWTDYVGYTRGYGGASGSGVEGTLSAPGWMHPSVRYLRPLIILNYSGTGQSGQTYCGAFRVDAFDGKMSTIDQITQANVSTFIENAAINSAQIQNAAIGTAHIQDAAVNTLQIAGQAVTIPVSVYGGNSCTEYSLALGNYVLDMYNGAYSYRCDPYIVAASIQSTGAPRYLSASFGVSSSGGYYSANRIWFAIHREHGGGTTQVFWNSAGLANLWEFAEPIPDTEDLYFGLKPRKWISFGFTDTYAAPGLMTYKVMVYSDVRAEPVLIANPSLSILETKR